MAQHSKPIGIVGCSAEGAALCYKTICTQSPDILGQVHAHPEVSVHTHSLADYVTCLDRQDLEGVGDLMLSSAHKLKAAGAEFLICPDNTIHQAFDYVQSRSPLPWLHIAESVVNSACERGFHKLGILGTRWLTDSNVYPEQIEKAGMEWLKPTLSERTEISRIIMEELVYGRWPESSVAYFQSVIKNLAEQGCDGVILGCTEIPLIIHDGNSCLPTLDSNRLLAEAAIRYSLQGG